MKIIQSQIDGCFQILSDVHTDNRGQFVKTLHGEMFGKLGIRLDLKEEFYSVSSKNVIRGMHFQIPPHDHIKLVYCVSGVVMDVVLDLRRGSPSYGKHEIFELSPSTGNSLYVPSGLAHGFCALQNNSVMVYKTTSVYSPRCDTGIRWDSFGAAWPSSKDFIISDRDKKLAPLDEFLSPFIFR